MASDWAEPPSRPTLSAAVVDVWRARLEPAPAGTDELLTGEERTRAGRLLRDQDRRRWAASRAILRALLGRYLGVDGRTIRFAPGAKGKPALAQGQLRFNLSHSDDLALYAFCQGAEVGIDLEHGRRLRAPLAVARRILGAEEEERISALEPAAQKREFLRSWVRHEAIAKCVGTGIGGGPTLPERVSVTELDVGPGAAGALAVAVPCAEARLFEWRG